MNTTPAPDSDTGTSSKAAALPAGGFKYEVAGAGQDKVADGGTLQNQSTTDEYVLGFVDKTMRYAVSLFLPLDVKAGDAEMKACDKNAFKKATCASIFIGSKVYWGTGGRLQVDSVADGKITGSFEFKALSEGEEVTVKGAFKEVPLSK